MAVKKTTYTNGEVLSPIYRIWISGKEIDFKRKQCVQSIDIKETVESSDVAVIKVADPEYLYLSDNLFLYDNPIKIQLGWSGTTYRYTFNGYISTIDIEFQDNGIPLITMSCMDNTHRMNKSKMEATLNTIRYKQVIRDALFKNASRTTALSSSGWFHNSRNAAALESCSKWQG